MVDDPDKRRASGASSYLVSVSEEPRSKARQHAPSAARNLEPILEVLKAHLPQAGRALEIGSGTGQHITALGQQFPEIDWLPSDIDAGARDSVSAWAAELRLTNIAEPQKVDVTQSDWHASVEGTFDVVVAINVVHITPWAATEGLMRGAGRLLDPGGLLYLYGPYKRDGAHTAESNIKFEQWLKGRSPDYGVSDMADVESEAKKSGLRLDDIVTMPSNNFSLIFRKP